MGSAPVNIESLPPEADIKFSVRPLADIKIISKKRPHLLWLNWKVDQQFQHDLDYLNLFTLSEVKHFTGSPEMLEYMSDRQPSGQRYILLCSPNLEPLYKEFETDPRIVMVVLYCKQHERGKGKELVDKYPKIKYSQTDLNEVQKILSRFESNPEITSTKKQLVFFTPNNIHALNKSRLNYHCLTLPCCEVRALKDFVDLARHLHPQEAENISKFEQSFKCEMKTEKKDKKILGWLMKENSFVWKMIQEIPKKTADPMILAYLRFVFKSGFEAISRSYKTLLKKKIDIYIVLQLNIDESLDIKKSLGRQFCFTTMTKGFTSEKMAKEYQKKHKNMYMCSVLNIYDGIYKALDDFGYYIDEDMRDSGSPNVLFNIFNVFTLKEESNKEMVLQYGALSQLLMKRINARKKEYQLKPEEASILRNYAFFCEQRSKVGKHAMLLQMIGLTKEAEDLAKEEYQDIRKTIKRVEDLDKYTLNLGDMYRVNCNYEMAKKKYDEVEREPLKSISSLHLFEMYVQMGQNKAACTQALKIEENLHQIRAAGKVEEFRALLYISMGKMLKGQLKQALVLLKKLKSIVSNFYEQDEYQGLSIVHDILQCMAQINYSLGIYRQAQETINLTIQFQQSCEGIISYSSKKSKGIQSIINDRIQALNPPTVIAGNQSHMHRTAIERSAHERLIIDEEQVLNRSKIYIDITSSPQQVPEPIPKPRILPSLLASEINPLSIPQVLPEQSNPLDQRQELAGGEEQRQQIRQDNPQEGQSVSKESPKQEGGKLRRQIKNKKLGMSHLKTIEISNINVQINE